MIPTGDPVSCSAASDAAPASSGGPAIEVLYAQELLGIGLSADILVVDDDETNLTAYEAALAPLGRRVVLVQSGMQALAQLLDQDFALLLLDVSMPGMSGLETAACVWFVRADGALVVEASHGVPAEYLEPWRVLPAAASLAMTFVQRERRALWVENAADYARAAPRAVRAGERRRTTDGVRDAAAGR